MMQLSQHKPMHLLNQVITHVSDFQPEAEEFIEQILGELHLP
jgi:hypothetical protein